MPFTQMVNGTLKRHHNSNSKSKWTVYRENKFYNALIIVENIGFINQIINLLMFLSNFKV